MTLGDLVEKLRDTHGSAGGFAVLRNHLEKTRELVAEREKVIAENITGKYLPLKERIHEEYNIIFGFIWALYSVGYLTEDERKEVISELMEVT